MNNIAFSSLIAFALLSMGLIAGISGTINYVVNIRSKSGRQMFYACWCVFLWNFGYAWMSMCYDSDIAYVARAIALLAITLYTVSVIRYVSTIIAFPFRKISIPLGVLFVSSIISWIKIIQKDAVDFAITPWGYWYHSKMTWGRVLQFATILGIIALYYIVMNYGKKHASSKRDLSLVRQFSSFGPIILTGCLLDTFIPLIFKSAAVPGSCIAAFISSMILYRAARQFNAFGLSVTNVSEYVFKDVKLPVIITDKDDRVVLYNAVALSYFECKEEEMINRKPRGRIEEIEKDLYKDTSTGKIFKVDKTDVYDKFDELLYTIYFVQDMTREREHLQMLEESRQIAEKANKAKSEFLANMSHEIRTPLNAVLGIDEMIIRESKDENIIDYAQNIKQAGNLLLSLINDILDFSKIESGKMEINDAESEATNLLDDVFLIIEEKAKSKNLEFIVDIDPRLPSKLQGDDVRMRQILINILNNSIKYTQQGSITFKSEFLGMEGDIVSVRTSIIDTGIGIKEEDLEKLFDAFQRVDISKNRDIEGSGLGLSITNNLLKLMGSELKVKSEYGKGSEFYFEIKHQVIDPTPIGDIKDSATTPKKTSEKAEGKFTAPTAEILIVDDNKINLKVASGLLKRVEAKITTALSGPESIELVQKNKYDLILMDHMMPDMDGIEAVSIIKKLENYPSKDAAIIALTANAISGAKEMFLENGFDDFIAKPIKVEELEGKLLEYLPKDKIIMSTP